MKSDSRQVHVETSAPQASGKWPGCGWRCKVFTYVNHDVGEDAMIYFAKNPRTQEILVNFYAMGKKSGWHSGVLSEGDDKSMFLKFNCKGDEQDLKNPCSYVLGLMILWFISYESFVTSNIMMYFLWVFCDI